MEYKNLYFRGIRMSGLTAISVLKFYGFLDLRTGYYNTCSLLKIHTEFNKCLNLRYKTVCLNTAIVCRTELSRLHYS